MKKKKKTRPPQNPLDTSKPLEDRELKRLAILPVAGLALYPKTIVPMHVVEDRDGVLMIHCTMKKRALGVPTLRPGAPPDAEGRPAVEAVMGAGRVLTVQPVGDGQGFLMLVHGIERVRMKKELPLHSDGFREIQAERLATVVGDPDQVAPLDDTLRELLLRLAEVDPAQRQVLEQMVRIMTTPEHLVDTVGWSVVPEEWRQRLLEELDLTRRIELAMEAVGMMVLTRTPLGGLPKG